MLITLNLCAKKVLLTREEIWVIRFGIILLDWSTCPKRHGFVHPLATAWLRAIAPTGPPFAVLHSMWSFVKFGLGFPAASYMLLQWGVLWGELGRILLPW